MMETLVFILAAIAALWVSLKVMDIFLTLIAIGFIAIGFFTVTAFIVV